MNMITKNMNINKNNVIANIANNKGYIRLYQAKLLIGLRIQAGSLTLSRSNLASYA